MGGWMGKVLDVNLINEPFMEYRKMSGAYNKFGLWTPRGKQFAITKALSRRWRNYSGV